MLGRRGRRRSVAPVHANLHFGEVGGRGQLTHGDVNLHFGEVAEVVPSHRNEGEDGGRCQENGQRPEVKEEWGCDLRAMGDENSSKERKKRKKKEKEEEKSSGGNDLLETLQLLGQEVNVVVCVVVGFVVVIFVVFAVVVFEIICLRHCSYFTKM